MPSVREPTGHVWAAAPSPHIERAWASRPDPARGPQDHAISGWVFPGILAAFVLVIVLILFLLRFQIRLALQERSRWAYDMVKPRWVQVARFAPLLILAESLANFIGPQNDTARAVRLIFIVATAVAVLVLMGSAALWEYKHRRPASRQGQRNPFA